MFSWSFCQDSLRVLTYVRPVDTWVRPVKRARVFKLCVVHNPRFLPPFFFTRINMFLQRSGVVTCLSSLVFVLPTFPCCSSASRREWLSTGGSKVVLKSVQAGLWVGFHGWCRLMIVATVTLPTGLLLGGLGPRTMEWLLQTFRAWYYCQIRFVHHQGSTATC